MKRYGDLPYKKLKQIAGTLENSGLISDNKDQIINALFKSGLFDEDYYKIAYPDVAAAKADPITHYVLHGSEEGRNPNLWFDTSFYRNDNPDIWNSITNEFLHFIQLGFKEGRRPNPTLRKAKKRLVLALLAGELPLHDILRALNSMEDCQPYPDIVVIVMPPPKKIDGLNQVALAQILARGVNLYCQSNYDLGDAILTLLADYADDILLLVDPLRFNFTKYYAWLIEALKKGKNHVHAVSCVSVMAGEGCLEIVPGKVEDSAFMRIPVIEAGLLVPPGNGAGVLANAPGYKKYAPNFPGIWFGAQDLLEKKNLLGLASAISPGSGSVNSKFQAKTFLKELLYTLYHFRYEINEIYGINILEMSTRKSLAFRYEEVCGDKLDWEHIETYNEKLQYLKLFDDFPLKSIASDKFNSRKYIRKVVGDEYIVPVLGIWKSFDDINFDLLPEKFILKTTHGSHQNVPVPAKRNFNKGLARSKFAEWLNHNLIEWGYEFNYFDIEPLILCEAWLGETIMDYKVFCFHGRPMYIDVISRNRNSTELTFFTTDWLRLEVEHVFRSTKSTIPAPANLSLMLDLAQKLAAPFAHARIDFYILPDNSLKVGEITFYDTSGFGKFSPASFDAHLGSLITIKHMSTN